MKRKRLTAVLAASVFTTAAPGARAQLDVPSAELVTQSRSRLPLLSRDIKAPDFAAYMRQLQAAQSRDAATNRALVTAVRVADDLAKAGLTDAWLLPYAVPAMSGQMRLPDAYPRDGRPNGEVRVVLAQDEYEPASFVVFPLANVDGVQLRVGELSTASGAKLPAGAVDLKVVKVWYQNGNAWQSYFQDPGSVLVPELLLHDENLIRVDTAKKANYARTKKGEVWLNQPYEIDSGFDPIAEEFADAEQLRPVKFEAGRGKQFVLTVHAAPGTAPGTYRGNILVSAAGRKETTIPVAVTVLPFQLPAPKANFDTKRDFIVTLMGSWPRTPADHPATLASLLNLRRHNLTHPPLYFGTAVNSELKSAIQLYKKAGFATNIILGGMIPVSGNSNTPPARYEELKRVEKVLLEFRDLFKSEFPNSEIFTTGGDEPVARWFVRYRPLWRLAHDLGFKTGISGHNGSGYTKAAYSLDLFNSGGSPADRDKAAPWNNVKSYVAFYANQHNGSENPDFVRRQHGLLGYLSNYDMVHNYEFAWGPWNDFGTQLYKPMVVAYPTASGIVDTLAWEGFRESIDDIRYATQLRLLAEEAAASGNMDRLVEARKCWAWFAELNGTTMDLNQVRLDMVEKILKFQSLKGGAK